MCPEETQTPVAEAEAPAVDTSLIGKPVEELTPAELAALASQLSSLTTTITDRQKSIRETAESEAFGKIAEVAKVQATSLAWAKLPPLRLVPNEAGDAYVVGYTTTKKGGGKRGPSDANSGAVTINKIGIAMGGIAWFKDKEGKEHEGIKDLIKSLTQTDGTPESDRCWDISKKGIAASDIVIKYHADEVTLVFNDGTEKLVKDAVEAMKAARVPA